MNNTNEELQTIKKELAKKRKETRALRKAIWDILNYSQMYIVVLDEKMNIQLINHSLAQRLGFENETDPIGRCWGDFLPVDVKTLVTIVHNQLVMEHDIKNYGEVVNEIQCLNGDVVLVKWFNIPVNGDVGLTFSFGLPRREPVEITEDSVRSYYSDILAKDRTMIQTLRDSIVGDVDIDHTCVIAEEVVVKKE